MPLDTAVRSDPPAPVADPASAAMVLLLSSHLLRAALKLGLPDAVGDEPVPVAELAGRTGCHHDTLLRLLRALAGIGIFRLTDDGRCAHTPISGSLRTSEAGRVLGQAATVDTLWQAWSGLDDAVRTGRCPFDTLHGTDFYSHLAEHDPEQSDAFHAAMNDSTAMTNEHLLDAVDLASATSIVDVGGGQGGLLRDVLLRHPHLRGTLFETPSVVPDALAELTAGPLAARCTVVAGDARESVPAGADVYLLRMVLHNWDDEGSASILASCAAAAGPGGRIIVVETLLAEDGPYASIAGMIDIGMFVTFGARERSRAAYQALFERAGLVFAGVTETPSLHLIEARVKVGRVA